MSLSLSEEEQVPRPLNERALLAALVDSAQDAIISKRLDGTMLSWNRAAQALFGYSAAEAIGQPVTRLIPADRLQEEADILASIGRGEAVAPFETVRLAKNGQPIDVSVAVSPVHDRDGRIVGASKIVRDIRPLLKSRAESEQYRGLVRASMDAIVALDDQMRICVFNPAAEAMFGHPAQAVLGQPLDRLLPEAAREVHRAHLRSFATTSEVGRRMAGALGVDARRLNALRADGSVFSVDASISRFGSGRNLRLMAVLRDMTALQRAEAMRLAAIEARAASDAKSAFIAQMTHELRTPLNAVLGFAHLLQTPGVVDAPHQRHVQHIYSAGRHLLSLIDDLLDDARIASGQLKVNLGPVPVAPLLADIQAVLQPMASTVSVTLVQDLAPDLACRADPVRLRQVLYNLVSNAIKYNRSRGTVQVRAGVVPEGVEICVADDGVGMSAEALAQLFEPYNRLGQDRGRIPGTGLGLVISRQLVGLMGGQLSVSSEPGRGTKACLTLPAAPAASAVPAEANIAVADAAAVRGRVLCIEDHPVNRMLIQSILGHFPGVSLAFAENGATGLVQLTSFQPDLVLLDLNLPDMHGLDWLAAVRTQPTTQEQLVVVVSASMGRQDAADARALGVADILSKPVDIEHLRRGVARWLRQAQLAKPGR